MGKRFKNKDLAARLGVSSTLVSLVLNNKADEQGIKKETQEKVLTMARQMGFFSKSKAEDEPSYPVEEKPGVLGMLVPSLNDPFVMQITPFLQKAFASIGVGFSLVTKDIDDQRYDRLVTAFRKFYSGLILYGETADENTVRSLRNADYPFIILEKNFRTLRLNTVSTDNEAGASTVISHIMKLGYKNILVFYQKSRKNSYADELSIITSEIGKHNSLNKPILIELDPVLSGDELDFSKFEHLIRPPYRADVILVMNATLVYPLMALLKKRNIRVPKDVAVISMEDGTGFELMYTPVTSLRKQISGMAVKVANMMWSEVKNSGKGKFKRQVMLAPDLIIRNSCGYV